MFTAQSEIKYLATKESLSLTNKFIIIILHLTIADSVRIDVVLNIFSKP